MVAKFATDLIENRRWFDDQACLADGYLKDPLLIRPITAAAIRDDGVNCHNTIGL